DLVPIDAPVLQFPLNDFHRLRFHAVAVNRDPVQQILGGGLGDIHPDSFRIELHCCPHAKQTTKSSSYFAISGDLWERKPGDTRLNYGTVSTRQRGFPNDLPPGQ